ncbi:hypothetical protein [Kribbella sp. NPDC050470]|uniref:hypothetical protein n=1 Tax=unclassified Kribbella TaxID=2644121 RepID=UPI00379D01B7
MNTAPCTGARIAKLVPSVLVCLALTVTTACGPRKDPAGPGATSTTPSPSVDTPMPPKQGRYQVTLNGFRVQAETWDDIWQWDGKGDEVFFSVGTRWMKADRTPVVPAGEGRDFVTESKLMGDTWRLNGRLQCGSRSNLGGIRTGDSCMNDKPNVLPPEGAFTDGRVPMEVTEGDLVQGQNYVVISPTIWEWDGKNSAVSDWAKVFSNALDKVPFPLTGTTGAVILTAVKVGVNILLTLDDVFGVAGDRPIGTGPRNAEGKYSFNPYVITLNYDAAEWLTKTSFGYGPGVLPLTYTDENKAAGRYQIFMQVRKVG